MARESKVIRCYVITKQDYCQAFNLNLLQLKRYKISARMGGQYRSFKFPAVVAVIYHQLCHTAVDANVLACDKACFV